MGYSVTVYSKKTKDKYDEEKGDLNFFEQEDNLIPFSTEEHELIKKHLLYRKYKSTGKRNLLGSNIEAATFLYDKESIRVEATLTGTSLYFSSRNGDPAFEASITAYEFQTDYGTMANLFAVLDLDGVGGWYE